MFQPRPWDRPSSPSHEYKGTLQEARPTGGGVQREVEVGGIQVMLKPEVLRRWVTRNKFSKVEGRLFTTHP